METLKILMTYLYWGTACDPGHWFECR